MTAPNTLSPEEQAAGWRLLFDGTTLNGWRLYGTPEGQGWGRWSVADGAIHVHGKDNTMPGDLITIDTFGDFELSLEWTCPDQGNSGIMYRVVEGDEHPYMSGPEYQILDNAHHRVEPAGTYATAGCYGMYGPAAAVPYTLNAWNHARIIARGNVVEHYLNGQRTVRFEMHNDDWRERLKGTKFEEWPRFAQASRGHIDLQDHGHHHAFRNIKIREL